MRTNLRIRRSGSPAAFDNEVCDFLKQPRWNNTNRATPGEWLRNLVAFSLANCTGFGATTLAIGVVVGEKLAYYSAGDAILKVFRKNNTTKGWVTVVETREQRIVIRTSDGSMQKCPVQLKVYQPDQQNGRHGFAEAVGGDHSTLKVFLDDIVLVTSDGVTDNLSSNEIKEFVTDGYMRGLTPNTIAKDLVDKAIAANIKPDDVSAAVGFASSLAHG